MIMVWMVITRIAQNIKGLQCYLISRQFRQSTNWDVDKLESGHLNVVTWRLRKWTTQENAWTQSSDGAYLVYY